MIISAIRRSDPWAPCACWSSSRIFFGGSNLKWWFPFRVGETLLLLLMDPLKCTARVESKSKAFQATFLVETETKVGARTSTRSWTACSARATASSTSWTWCAGTGLHITTVILSSDSAGSSQSSSRTRTWGPGPGSTPTASSPCQYTSAPRSPSARLSTPRCLSVTILTVSSSTTERSVTN